MILVVYSNIKSTGLPLGLFSRGNWGTMDTFFQP